MLGGLTGKLIVLEGLSNAGKTSLASTLAESLRDSRHCFKAAFELSSKIGATLDSQFRNNQKMSPKYKALAFAADRMDLVDNLIVPNLVKGYHVIIDRYSLTSVVYHSQEGVTVEWLRLLDNGIPKPNLTIIVDISAELSISRAMTCGKPTPYTVDYLREARKRYLSFSGSRNTVTVNGEREFELVLEECRQIIRSIILD